MFCSFLILNIRSSLVVLFALTRYPFLHTIPPATPSKKLLLGLTRLKHSVATEQVLHMLIAVSASGKVKASNICGDFPRQAAFSKWLLTCVCCRNVQRNQIRHQSQQTGRHGISIFHSPIDCLLNRGNSQSSR